MWQRPLEAEIDRVVQRLTAKKKLRGRGPHGLKRQQESAKL